jgi:hypothetical protein
VPNPGFEAAGVPADVWGSRLARATAVVHGGATALAQTATATSGGWDLDANSAWYAPVTPGKAYTASVWVRSTAAAKAVLNVDLLTSAGKYVTSAGGAKVTLVPGTWTKLTVTVKPTGSQTVAAMEPNFSGTTSGTILYWDDMSVA